MHTTASREQSVLRSKEGPDRRCAEKPRAYGWSRRFPRPISHERLNDPCAMPAPPQRPAVKFGFLQCTSYVMKRLIPVAVGLQAVVTLMAHPGSGIAVDDQGRVFFTAGPMIVMVETDGVARTIVHDKAN